LPPTPMKWPQRPSMAAATTGSGRTSPPPCRRCGRRAPRPATRRSGDRRARARPARAPRRRARGCRDAAPSPRGHGRAARPRSTGRWARFPLRRACAPCHHGPMLTLQELSDKQEIADVVARYCRGVDRMDFEAVRACYHVDGIDHHTGFDGMPTPTSPVAHAAGSVQRDMHVLGNQLIEVRGDVARSESYGNAHHWASRPTTRRATSSRLSATSTGWNGATGCGGSPSAGPSASGPAAFLPRRCGPRRGGPDARRTARTWSTTTGHPELRSTRLDRLIAGQRGSTHDR